MRRDVEGCFDRDYSVCRDKFLATANRLDLVQQSFLNPIAGSAGETLTTDTALLGDSDADNLIILISGTHGLEAFAGSGIQIGLLDVYSKAKTNGTAILFVHALNPWGAAHLRRQNEDNVDVNRNFLNPSELPIDNKYYDLLHPIIHRSDFFIGGHRNREADLEIESFVNAHGHAAYCSALFQGQSRHADGVGYSGLEPCWSNLTIKEICHKYGADRTRVAIIDLHTGLGRFGHGSLMLTQATNGLDFEIARRWFGNDLISIRDAKMVPYQPIGDMISTLQTLFASRTTVVGVALEFGTYEEKLLMQSQVDDSWLEQFGENPSPTRDSIKKASVDFFCPNSSEWQEQVFFRSKQVITRLAVAMQQ